MTERQFHQDIKLLQDEVLVLGSMVENALQQSVNILRTQDHSAAQRLIAEDKLIDEKRYVIEAEVLTLIATQQPMAVDVRVLAAVLFIVNELERIGDYGKGIARISIRIGDEPLMKPLIDIPRMMNVALEMLHASLQSFTQGDINAAREIIGRDAMVDSLYEQIYRELMTLIIQDVHLMTQANLLLFAAHNLERAADRVTNICERTIYSVTGDLIETGWDEDDEPQHAQFKM